MKHDQKRSYNVVALGARDYYQVPIGLHKAGLLWRLITDFYAGRFLSIFTKKRSSPDLPGRMVWSSWVHMLLARLLNSAALNEQRRKYLDFSFGFLAGLLTHISTNRAIVYSYYLEGFFAYYDLVGRRPLSAICFQVHPTPWFINEIMSTDSTQAKNQLGLDFIPDIESSYNDHAILRYKECLSRCDGVIAASNVTVRSLGFEDVATQDILIVPYGSKLTEAPLVEERRGGDRIRLVSVCQVLQRKGLHWAYEAMNRLPVDIQDRFEWVIVAKNIDPAIHALMPKNCTVKSGLSNEELASEMLRADLFVMPSLLEGFGLVYIESLSQGTPILYTENTGADDFCEDWVHGFRVRVSNVDDIQRVFESIALDPSVVASMRGRCLLLARQITWDCFQGEIVKFIENMEMRRVSD